MPSAVPADMCHCGRPLHYRDPLIRSQVERFVAELGRYVIVTVDGKGSFHICRHYIALHGLEDATIETRGFERVV